MHGVRQPGARAARRRGRCWSPSADASPSPPTLRGAAAQFPAATSAGSPVAGTVNDLARRRHGPWRWSPPSSSTRARSTTCVAYCVSRADDARGRLPIVTGDTKVVQRGAPMGCSHDRGDRGDRRRTSSAPAAVCEGDAVILSGTIGDHGLAVLAARGEFDSRRRSGRLRAALGLCRRRRAAAVRGGGRGGALLVRHHARRSHHGAGRIAEERAWASRSTSSRSRLAAGVFGLRPARRRPLTLANEGKMVLVMAAEAADAAPAAARPPENAREARRIGRVRVPIPVASRCLRVGHASCARHCPWTSRCRASA